LRDEYGRIPNQQIFICAKSGYGKGFASEGIAEEFHDTGKFITIVIADPKDEWEWAYAMFKPRERYHLKELKRQGKEPSKKEVKIYVPFSFNIPNTYLPEFIPYTLSLKSMGREEWSILAELTFESESIRLLLQACREISNEDGIYGLLHYIQDLVKRRKKGKEIQADSKSFYLPIAGGTSKSTTEIAGYLQPFKQDYILAKENCPLNLSWKEILSNQKPYYIFTNGWITDEKIKEFLVLSLLNQIIKNRKFAKRPILIIIPEIGRLTPNLRGIKTVGYKSFLANKIRDLLITMRSMGKGISSIYDSQIYWKTDEDVVSSATVTLFGEVSTKDSEQISKVMNYKREIRDQLKKSEYEHSFVVAGREDIGGITIFAPSHAHCEESDNFFERYHEEYSDKERKYVNTIEMMKKMYKQEEEKFREKIKRKQKEEREKKLKEEREKEKERVGKDKVDEKIDKAKEIEKKSKIQLMKLIYEMKESEPEISWRELGRRFEIDTKTAQKYYGEYEKIKEEKEGEDYEEKVVEDLNEEKNSETT